MIQDITIDFETRSRADLGSVGTYRYARDESTAPICLSYKYDDEPANIWTENMMPPHGLFSRIKGNLIHAFNAQFEIEIWREVMCKRFNWPQPPPLEFWRDTMAEVAVAGYPQAMDKAAKVMGATEKDKEGKRLINFLCKPIASGKRKGYFRKYEDFPTEYQAMYRYCIQDVDTEREMHNMVHHYMTPKEYKVWRSVVKMNQAGLPIDVYGVDVVSDRIAKTLENNNKRLSDITRGLVTKPTQVQKMKKYLVGVGCDIPNLQEDTVTLHLALDNISPSAREVLEIRATTGKTSVSKFEKIKVMLCDDNTIKGNLRYYGAGPGRHSGLGFQPQNLPRFTLENPEEVLRIYHEALPEVLEVMYPVVATAVGLIRGMIRAPAGKSLFVSDLSQIEAICVPWLLSEEGLLANIRAGKDLYKTQSSYMYDCAYEDVTGTQRQAGKIAVLACGFAGGGKTFVLFAAGYRLEFTLQEGKTIVNLFRKSRPKVPQAWKDFGAAAVQAVTSPGYTVSIPNAKDMTFLYKAGTLEMKLVSGRCIYYPQAKLYTGLNRFENMTTSVHCGHIDSYTKQWEVREMTGALLFQNAIQGTCRDILVESQINLEAAGYTQIGSIHDEGVGVAGELDPMKTIEDYDKIMSTNPAWCPDFPINSNGYKAKRYKKD